MGVCLSSKAKKETWPAQALKGERFRPVQEKKNTHTHTQTQTTHTRNRTRSHTHARTWGTGFCRKTKTANLPRSYLQKKHEKTKPATVTTLTTPSGNSTNVCCINRNARNGPNIPRQSDTRYHILVLDMVLSFLHFFLTMISTFQLKPL